MWRARSRSRIGRWVWLLPILAGALMIVGLARPQRAHSRTEVTANGIDIVLGLDVSGSMQALDFAIDNRRVNRIEVVKSVVSKFIEERPNDRIGLIAFAGAPYLVSPITLDHDWLQQNLERVNVAGGHRRWHRDRLGNRRQRQPPAHHGSQIESGHSAHRRREQHRQDLAARRRRGGQGHGRQDLHHRRRACAAMRRFRVKDQAGRLHLIMAKVDVDEKTLQAVADETGGKFYRATDTDSLQKIYEQINRFEKTAQTVQKFEHTEELYPWALIPALAILGLGLLLQQTRLRRLP